MKKEKDYKFNFNDTQSTDIEAEDFLEMNYRGLSDQEIAKELGVDYRYVKNIKNQFHKDY
ncbi:MAG: helix-turn-helix domain-containing protein [Clostridiaceae bacterium]|nr:helix-turn-helix domain-containing protein [Clostridiaceae bacterium]